ncbi:hypothetical protein V6N11_034320 [Hibiscus sabdariffa]|uniref:Uncharacterized protein n=1 Tax=Hibiscus sabdariffa TaxID=183260 RepID=A0ABR1ZYV2_9ROSI
MPIGVTLSSHPEFDPLGIGNERALLGTLSKPGRNVEVSPHMSELLGGLGLCRGPLPGRRSYASPTVAELKVPVHTHFKFRADGRLYHTK